VLFIGSSQFAEFLFMYDLKMQLCRRHHSISLYVYVIKACDTAAEKFKWHTKLGFFVPITNNEDPFFPSFQD
jgi:hypothetical protein